MEELDKTIKANLEIFNSEEPPKGHFERFRKKLGQQKGKQKITIVKISKAAAIILFVGVSSFFTYKGLLKPDAKISSNIVNSNTDEYNETDFYYASMLESKYDELKTLTTSDSIQQKMLLKELTEADLLYIRLKEDLKENPDDERIISTMIEHYQMKLEIMNKIILNLKQIQNINKGKEPNYESTEI